ncbi:MAG: MutS family DNA mismatch repair protein [Flavisolibacter sp.]
MQIDKLTFDDISVFHPEEEFSIFHKLDFTKTVGGRQWLRRFFTEPHHDLKRITGTQNIIKTILIHLGDWPGEITNGTIIMMDKFLDYNLDPVPENQTLLNSFTYKLFHGPDYSMIKYSVRHFGDFLGGMKKLIHIFSLTELPSNLNFYLERIKKSLAEEPLKRLANRNSKQNFTLHENIYYAHCLRTTYKGDIYELLDIFGRLEAWYSMAMAVKSFNLQFPEFLDQQQSYFKAEGLYHILLQQPKSYDLAMEPNKNFLFLTGANMAGKSTLIKAIGSSVFLAHLGMGVPAVSLKLSLFDGLLTNINVSDNIAKGESYFFNEVQRIKNTIYKINDGKKWMVLIDELFKGTNVQDAMKCSLAVIKGLVKIRHSLFVLSTHLYELGEELKNYPVISFKHFETTVLNDQLSFSYQLKEGISDDRIGYIILRRENVVDMLDKL